MTDKNTPEDTERNSNDSDKSQEEIIKEDKKEKTFEDLPISIIKEILGKLNLGESILVSDVCTFFHDYVTKRCPRSDKVELEFNPYYVSLSVENRPLNSHPLLKYSRYSDGTLIEINGKTTGSSDGGTYSYLECCFKSFEFLLKNMKPKKLIIHGCLFLSPDVKEMTNSLMKSMFETIGHPVDVEEIEFNVTSFATILVILQNLNENCLQRIVLSYSEEENRLELERIKELEQWKKAKEVSLSGPSEVFNISDVIEKNKFEYFEYFTMKEAIRIVQTVSQSQNFESAYIMVDWKSENRNELKEALEGCTTTADENFLFYKIPGSHQMLEIKCDFHGMKITKKN